MKKQDFRKFCKRFMSGGDGSVFGIDIAAGGSGFSGEPSGNIAPAF